MTPQDEADLRRLVLAEYRRNECVAASCDGKEAFEHRAQAVQVVDRMRKAKNGDRRLGAPVYCKVCGKWHIHGSVFHKPKRGKDGHARASA